MTSLSSGDFALEGIRLAGSVIMDAGTGAANTTCWLASKLKEDGGGRIISIDNDPETFPDARRKLGELANMVEFVKADLTSMPEIKSESVDLVMCHATICAVNNRPLRAVMALSEFHRTLKDGGWLIVDDEYPLPKASKPEEEVQVKRWQTYKSVAELVDGEHYTEIYPEELEFAAKTVGFRSIESQRFEGGPLSEAAMSEWKEEMPGMINKIDDRGLKTAFENQVDRIWELYGKRGGIFPPYYVMRMRK